MTDEATNHARSQGTSTITQPGMNQEPRMKGKGASLLLVLDYRPGLWSRLVCLAWLRLWSSSVCLSVSSRLVWYWYRRLMMREGFLIDDMGFR